MLNGKKSPDAILIMERLSSEYGWTPDEVRNQKIQDINDYLLILKIKSDIARRESKKHR